MCDVTTALLVAGAAAGYKGQQDMAAAQEAANNQGRELALQNRDLQIQALKNAEEEEAIRASEALRQNSQAAEAARATARVAAGESGISGLSVDALLNDLTMQESRNKQDVLQTQDFGQRQRQLDFQGVQITGQSQVNQMPIVEYPNFLETAGTVGGQAYYQYKRNKALEASTE